jgi:hypothetical protein
MTGGEDRLVVLKHIHAAHRPGAVFDMALYRDVRRRCRELLRQHFPVEMSVRMVLKPLGLGARTQRFTVPIVAALARRVVP